ncbi:MAG: hypothetical protein WD424_08875 [Paenibacillaceae bacterium]
MIHNESGRFTIESTLIFPMLFIITISCLLISIGAARHVGLSIEATTAAGRASFSWSNSSKNPVTGAYYPGQYDDLYWRLSDDRSASPLAVKKVSSALTLIPEGLFERGQYKNSLLQRDIHVEVKFPFRAPEFMTKLYGSRELIGNGNSSISEPVELIRQVELARSYWPIIKKVFSTERSDSAIEDFRKRSGKSEQEQLAFHSHDEARAYLQKIVHGHLSRRTTEHVGEWRLIDALDGNGIAHQAYYGFKDWDSKIEAQLSKDAEILGKGQVNGVVWHFFKRERDRSIGLSNKLRTQLEARGIVIVVHE